MSSEYNDINCTPPAFHCAAGVYCQIPHINFATSPHKCFFCKKFLHGICGVLHDPNDITYHSRCNACHRKYFGPDKTSQPLESLTPLDISSQPLKSFTLDTDSTVTHSKVQLSSTSFLPPNIPMTAAFVPIQGSGRNYLPESIGHLSMHSSSGASTPIVLSTSRTTTPTFGESGGLLDENGMEEIESTPILDWFALDIGDIYDHLNPRTKQGQVHQRGWQKRAVDGSGKLSTSIGLVANRLLKLLVTKKFISDLPLNTKLQSKKVDREQQKNLFMNLKDNLAAVHLIWRFLVDNIFLPVNADGDVINVEEISVHIGARVIMLVADPGTSDALSSIFSLPAKEE
jgi:hypothetical protein